MLAICCCLDRVVCVSLSSELASTFFRCFASTTCALMRGGMNVRSRRTSDIDATTRASRNPVVHQQDSRAQCGLRQLSHEHGAVWEFGRRRPGSPSARDCSCCRACLLRLDDSFSLSPASNKQNRTGLISYHAGESSRVQFPFVHTYTL